MQRAQCKTHIFKFNCQIILLPHAETSASRIKIKRKKVALKYPLSRCQIKLLAN